MKNLSISKQIEKDFKNSIKINLKEIDKEIIRLRELESNNEIEKLISKLEDEWFNLNDMFICRISES